MSLLAYWKDDYAEISLQKEDGYVKLYINNGLQFSEEDEYRYHHSVFVLPALCVEKPYEHMEVLILGGGDGLGARDLIRLGIPPANIDLVDISPFMVLLSQNHPEMVRLNEGSMMKVNVIREDGLEYVKRVKGGRKYDLIVLDYPDPSWDAGDPVNRLFSEGHYRDVFSILTDDGVVAMQATSVAVSPNVFRWLQLKVQSSVGASCIAGRVNISTYRDIGFLIMRREGEIAIVKDIPEWVFFDERSVQTFFFLHRDEVQEIPDEVLSELAIHEVVYYDLVIAREGRGLPDFIIASASQVDLNSPEFAGLRQLLSQ